MLMAHLTLKQPKEGDESMFRSLLVVIVFTLWMPHCNWASGNGGGRITVPVGTYQNYAERVGGGFGPLADGNGASTCKSHPNGTGVVRGKEGDLLIVKYEPPPNNHIFGCQAGELIGVPESPAQK